MLLKFDKILRKSIGDDDTPQHFYSIYMKSEKKSYWTFGSSVWNSFLFSKPTKIKKNGLIKYQDLFKRNKQVKIFWRQKVSKYTHGLFSKGSTITPKIDLTRQCECASVLSSMCSPLFCVEHFITFFTLNIS